MNRFLTLDWIWCLTLVLSPAFQAGKLDISADTGQKVREIVSVLRLVWGPDFDSDYGKYMLGSSPIVTLIPREEMIKIADGRLDGRLSDGKITQGLSTGDRTNARIVVVYDDIAPLLVAKTIMHEIGHLELTDKGLSRSNEEARVRKTVDTSFFERVFGREWLEMTVTALEKKILPVEKNGRVYQGYTPDAVELFYQQLGKAGRAIERNPLHDKIVATMVFTLTNSEKDPSSALDSEDDPNVQIGALSAPADGQELTLADVDRIISQAFRSGNFGEAARYLRIALQKAEAGGASAEERVAMLGNLGEMLRSARQYEEAEPYFNRALDILRASSIVDKSYLAVILVNLGTLYQETGRYPLSESSLKQALSLTERELGANHWNMSKVHNSLGILYSSTNKRKEAEASFRKALALEEKQPDQNRILAPILGNLAGLYMGQKRWDRAEPLLIRALDISESYFGEFHPETAVILEKLGLAYSGQKKLKLAETTFRRALELRYKLFGPDDRTVASTSFFLAQVLTAQGSFDEAKLRYAESLQVREKIFGPKAAEVATTLEEFAKLLRKTRNNEGASAMEARAKYIRAEINYTMKVRTGQRE